MIFTKNALTRVVEYHGLVCPILSEVVTPGVHDQTMQCATNVGCPWSLKFKWDFQQKKTNFNWKMKKRLTLTQQTNKLQHFLILIVSANWNLNNYSQRMPALRYCELIAPQVLVAAKLSIAVILTDWLLLNLKTFISFQRFEIIFV